MKIFKKEVVARFVKFGMVGAVGFLVHLVVLNFQMLFTSDSFYLRAIAPFFSFEAAALSNYALYHHWVWLDRRKETKREYWVGFVHYNLAVGFTFLLNLGVMNLLVEWFKYINLWRVAGRFFSWLKPLKFYINLGSIIAVLMIAVLNFILTDKLIFRKEKKSA